MPNSCPIDKTETTNKIVFISLNSNVYSDKFSSELSTCLLDRERFTITRESSNERRVEQTGLNDFANIIEITKLDEGIIFLRDKVLFYGRQCCRCLISAFDFFHFLLSHFKIPLTTSHFIIGKFVSDSLIVGTIHCTPSTNVSSSHRFTIKFLKRSADIVGRERHDVGCSFQLKLLYKEKGVSLTPCGQFRNWTSALPTLEPIFS